MKQYFFKYGKKVLFLNYKLPKQNSPLIPHSTESRGVTEIVWCKILEWLWNFGKIPV